MTFSFQVTQSDEICCYLIWNGQHSRFYPQDIMEVLPLLFVDRVSWELEASVDLDPERQKMKEQQMKLVYNNETFKNSLEAKKFAEMMEIEDLPFESWYSDLCELDDEEFPKYNQNIQ